MIPAQIGRHVAGWTREQVWQSAPDAITWRLTGPDGQVRYLKTRAAGAAVPVPAEAARLRWALRAGLPVPRVLAACTAGQADWLLTDALPGLTAVTTELQADPGQLARLLGAGLRRFHQAPAAGCPFRFGPEQAMAQAIYRLRGGLVPPGDLHPEHAGLGTEAALAELTRLRPARADLVVCHGDYCLPNVMITAGRVTGYLDLGQLAVADRWYDLAVGTWSVTWNLGPGWEDEFLSGYGVRRDDQAIAFYRLIYDLTA
jgi:aminoglycoside phosphotransferase